MNNTNKKIAFGPVPSRRLGQSIGINNIPPKTCTYACLYCQIGKTNHMQIKRQKFYSPHKIIDEVKQKIKKTKEKNENIDYLTFVPDGEPTLDINLGKEIALLKKIGYKVAVITNSSLLWDKTVQDDLLIADCVSVKIDAFDEKIWKKINRPQGLLNFEKITKGIYDFSKIYKGKLLTETMIVKNINDSPQNFEKIAKFIKKLNSSKSYLSIPIRPPSEKFAISPSESNLNHAYNIFKTKGLETELLIGYEGNAFAFTGDVEEDLLSIISVHPMRKDAVEIFLKKADEKWDIIKNLIDSNKVVETVYNKNKFYIRKLN